MPATRAPVNYATKQTMYQNWPDYCGYRAPDMDAICVGKTGHDGDHELFDNLTLQRLGNGNWAEVSRERDEWERVKRERAAK